MLTGENIQLRKMQASDVDVIFNWENNPDNWDVSDTKESYTKEEIVDFVAAPQDLFINNQLRLMISTNPNELLIGCIDLFELDFSINRAGVGILIGEEAHRNKGLANEALVVLIKYAFNDLKLNQLFCNISPSNTASIHLFKKNGFQFIEKRELFGQQVNYYELKC